MKHHDDFEVGQEIELGSYAVSADEIVAFAREFDPQDFHLSEEAGRASILGGLAASGWQVSSIMMKLIATGWLNHTHSMGSNQLLEVKWLKPVLAGDVLSARMKILEKRVSSKRPEMGIFSSVFYLSSASGELKTEMRAITFMRVRPAC
jgi:acyl dehydratase